jgi:hypothetical protein
VKLGVYRHYKGGYYLVTGTAADATNGREDRTVVFYTSMSDGKNYARDWAEFADFVLGPGRRARVPRFTYLGETYKIP